MCFRNFAELSTEHLSAFNHFVTRGVLPVQELSQPLADSFLSLGVNLNSLATKLEPLEPPLDLPLLTDRLEDYLASVSKLQEVASETPIKCEAVLDPDISTNEDLPLKKRSGRKRKRVSYAETNDFSPDQGTETFVKYLVYLFGKDEFAL